MGMGCYEVPGYLQFQAEEQGILLTHSQSTTTHALLAPMFPAGMQPAAGSLTVAVLTPAAGNLSTFTNRPADCSLWAPVSTDSFDAPHILSFPDSRLHHGSKMDVLFKLGAQQGTNSRLGNMQYGSNGQGISLLQHGSLNGKLQAGLNPSFGGADSIAALPSAEFSMQHWADDRNHSPYRTSTLISSFRGAQDGSSSPFESYSSSPRGVDFRTKRHSNSSTNGSPRTPTHGVSGHRIGIDPRLVVGSPLEIAWEVLQQKPGVACLLNLQPGIAKLRNLPVQEDRDGDTQDKKTEKEAEAPNEGAAAGREPETPLSPEQLTHEQGLVRSCRGLPARVRDDLIKAARLAVTRRDSSGRELPGTGLLPFFFRVQSNLKWLLQQPATLKGQLLPCQIDFITDEQRSQSFQKTVQQRVRLGELAVMLHQLLRVPEDGADSTAGAA